MTIKFSPSIAPLISTVLFMLGNGYLTTFISIRMKEFGHSEQAIGLVASAFYIGLVLGATQITKLIVKIGHLRVFTIFVGLFNTVCLLHTLSDNVYLWFTLRLLAGVALSGFYITIESWLLECSSPISRGKTLALYMIALSSAQAFSQLLLHKYNVSSLFPFIVITTFLSLSIIPVAISKNKKAQEHDVEPVSMSSLAKVASSSVAICLISGLVISVIYSLLPVFFNVLTGNAEQTAYLMFATLVGGMVIQYPIGLLSDNFDRRKVVIGVNLIIVSILLSTIFIGHKNIPFTNLLMIYFVLGGLSFTFYPLALSMVCDNLRSANVASVSQKLSMIEGVGAISGPLIAPIFIYFFGIKGLSIYFTIASVCLIIFLIYRVLQIERTSNNNFFVAVHTTPLVAELDPRSEEEPTDTNTPS